MAKKVRKKTGRGPGYCCYSKEFLDGMANLGEELDESEVEKSPKSERRKKWREKRN